MIKKIFFFFLFFLFLASLNRACPYAFASGKKADTYSVAMYSLGEWDAEDNHRFDISVWYPGVTTQRIIQRDGWLVVGSSHTRAPAKVIPGFYPIILFSHDTASSRFANNDLAAILAEQGFFVVVANHTGDNLLDSSKLNTAELFLLRPHDLLRALDTVLSRPEFAPFIDESRIGLVGIGFGATTVAQLAGFTPSPAQLATFCERARQYDSLCFAQTPTIRVTRDTEFEKLLHESGTKTFTPRLDTYAPPILESVPAPVTLPSLALTTQIKTKSKNSFSIRTFLGINTPEASFDNPFINKKNPDELLVYIVDFEEDGLQKIFQKQTVSMRSTHTPLRQVHKKEMNILEGYEKKLRADPRPYRRPSSVRKIKSIAFLAPLGGMMFSPSTSEPPVHLPALFVLPGSNSLYLQTEHAFPYRYLFPTYSLVRTIKSADHYGLFAPCSDELRTLLPATCDQSSNDERKKVITARNNSFVQFFRQTLGAPIPPQPPTGLKATHLPTNNATLNSTVL